MFVWHYGFDNWWRAKRWEVNSNNNIIKRAHDDNDDDDNFAEFEPLEEVEHSNKIIANLMHMLNTTNIIINHLNGSVSRLTPKIIVDDTLICDIFLEHFTHQVN